MEERLSRLSDSTIILYLNFNKVNFSFRHIELKYTEKEKGRKKERKMKDRDR